MPDIRPVIIVARRQDKLPETLAALKDANLPVVGLPVSRTTPLKTDIPPATHGLVLTSSAAVPAVRESDLPCYCVGPKTARAAEKAGLQVLYTGSRGGRTLAREMAEKFPPQSLCHVTTEEAGTAWYTILTEAGFSLKTRYGYETTYLDTLPHEVVCCFRENRVSSLMVFSSRGAEKTCELIKKACFAAKDVPHLYAISDAVARALADRGIPGANIEVADTPTSEEIIHVLEQSLNPENRHTGN